MSTKIRIEIDLGELDHILPGGGDDDNYVCPVATQDDEVNAENKLVGIKDYSYGKARCYYWTPWSGY